MGLLTTRRALISGGSSWVLPFSPTFDIKFGASQYFGTNVGNITAVRATTNATDLLPSSAAGYAYKTYGANIPRISTVAGGLICEEARTQLLASPTVPATQTTVSLATGVYTLWVNGTGTATPSGGTATITGAAAASNGSPNVFTVTVAGTVVVTVAGSLNAFQCELGTWGSSLITTQAVRNVDNVTLSNPPTFGAQYSMFASGTPLAPTAYATAQFMVEIDDGSGNNRFFFDRTASTGLPGGGEFGGGAGNSVTIGAGAWAQNALGSIAGSTKATSQLYAFTGRNTASSADANQPVTPTNFRFGFSQAGTQSFNGIISRVAYFGGAFLSSNNLLALTG